FLLDTFLTAGALDGEDERARALASIELQVAQVRKQFADQDHLRANLLDALGGVCLRLSLPDEAEEPMREARDIRRRTLDEETLEVALRLSSLGHLHYAERSLDEAEANLTRALALHRTLPEGVHTDIATAANDLACVLRAKGELERAEELHREALARRIV